MMKIGRVRKGCTLFGARAQDGSMAGSN